MLFRARGEPKGPHFGPKAPEWTRLRDARRPPGQVFDGLSASQLRASVERLMAPSDEAIAARVEANLFDGWLSELLLARRRDVQMRGA